MTNSTTRHLLYFLFLKSCLIIAIILYARIGLSPDEAQYWTWSQALDWGYYSKPPGIAWQIWLGTQLFGQTEFGVRALSVLLAICQSLLIYQLALRSELSRQTAYWCGLMMAFCPFGILGSFLAITDGGFLLCWTAACLVIVKALQGKKDPNPLHIGIWILIGALFKWPIYFFWFFFLCCCYWFFPTIKKTRVVAGIFISLLGLLPSIWWNGFHDWATFRHVLATLQGGSGHQASGNGLAFLGSQALLLSPILFILLLYGLWHWIRQRQTISPPLFFCGLVTLVSLSLLTFLSYFQKIQGNWGIFAYPTGFVILGWSVFQKSLPAFLAKVGLMLSVAMTLLIFAFPSFYLFPSLSSYAPSFHLNPFKHNLGWTTLSQALKKQGYDPHEHFLFSDKYQTTSLLSFYAEDQKRAYFLNLQGVRKNQFSYWPTLQEERKGQIGYFVWVENQPHFEPTWQNKREFYQTQLEYHFEKVEFVELVPLIYQGAHVAKGALLFRCWNCHHLQPEENDLY